MAIRSPDTLLLLCAVGLLVQTKSEWSHFPPFKAKPALKYEIRKVCPEEEASAWSLETRLRTQNS